MSKTEPPRGNCIFCHTYYYPMLIKLDEWVCHDCWREVIQLVKSELAEYND